MRVRGDCLSGWPLPRWVRSLGRSTLNKNYSLFCGRWYGDLPGSPLCAVSFCFFFCAAFVLRIPYFNLSNQHRDQILLVLVLCYIKTKKNTTLHGRRNSRTRSELQGFVLWLYRHHKEVQFQNSFNYQFRTTVSLITTSLKNLTVQVIWMLGYPKLSGLCAWYVYLPLIRRYAVR